MNRKTIVLSVFLILCMLQACTSQKVDQQLVAEPDPVSLRLAAAVDRASTALQTLASIEQARNPSVTIESVSDAPKELNRTMSINWAGPIEPLTQKLADRAGYKFQINGSPPAVPLIISLRSREKSVIEVLRDIGLQAGKRANIVVNVEDKTVELNYASTIGY